MASTSKSRLTAPHRKLVRLLAEAVVEECLRQVEREKAQERAPDDEQSARRDQPPRHKRVG